MERSAPPPGRPHSRRAPALHPRRGPAVERPGPPGKLRDAGALALGRPLAGHRAACQREQGAGSGRPESRRSEGRSLPGEAAEGARPPAAGRGVGRAPPLGGAAPSRAVPRRSVVPAARLEAGPARRPGCAPRLARGLPGGRWSRPRGARCSPRLLPATVDEISHADLALPGPGAGRGRVVRALCAGAGASESCGFLGFVFLVFTAVEVGSLRWSTWRILEAEANLRCSELGLSVWESENFTLKSNF